MADEIHTTMAPLSARAKQMVLKAMSSHRIDLRMARYRTNDEDKISELDMDISYADAVIQVIEGWEVKRS